MPDNDLDYRANILRFWRAVEYFSPQTAPSSRDHTVLALGPESLAPWEEGHPNKEKPFKAGQARLHKVYAGFYKLEGVRQALAEKLGADLEDYDDFPLGDGCLFTLTFTDSGRPLFDTFVVSSSAWATGQTLSLGANSPQWLEEDFSQAERRVASSIQGLLRASEDDRLVQEKMEHGIWLGRECRSSDLHEAVTLAIQALGVESLFGPFWEIRVKTFEVMQKYEYSVSDNAFLNSFFIRDLTKVTEQIRLGNVGKGLIDFLKGEQEVDVSRRADVREQVRQMAEKLSPTAFPAGKWPGRGGHPLVYSQQLAVNAGLKALGDSSGLFAVNGPPGTGKTTLLRDFVAAVVVERAKRLSELNLPGDAFHSHPIKLVFDGYTQNVHILHDQFLGFEMVIASSNNGAVENVSLELPSVDAIDNSLLLAENDIYFRDIATYLHQRPAWGLIAARLGNKENRSEFSGRVWWGNQDPGLDYQPRGDARTGIRTIVYNAPLSIQDWRDAVARFRAAVGHEEALLAERYRASQLMDELKQANRKLEPLLAELQQAKSRRDDLKTDLVAVGAAVEELEAEASDARRRRLEHREFRPGFLQVLFSLGRDFQDWRAKDRVLAERQDDCERRARQVISRQTERTQQLRSVESDLNALQSQVDLMEQQVRLKEEAIDKAKSRYGEHFPDWDVLVDDEELRERSAPWADSEWNRARMRVFVEALQLHRCFILANGKRMYGNLGAAFSLVEGKLPIDPSEEAIRSAWASLFMLVPLLSTTFASFDRVFATVGREQLGWLFIDEAGQATPQAAVGGIWRSRRTVLLGDPLQLEPIVSIPKSVQEALRRRYSVAGEWMPALTSAQQVADRLNVIGTYIADSTLNRLWVGAPLRVHRRCEQPMFSISNRVAYDGLMIYGTSPRPPLDLPHSQWFDVRGEQVKGHWIEEEWDQVDRLLKQLLELEIPASEIMLLTPFRKVADELAMRRRNLYRALTVGTIHVSQGREAEVVIFVLGSDPDKPGSRRWASSKPNLLNVAASRAKKRFYIIGNRNLWEKENYFNIAAAILDKHSRSIAEAAAQNFVEPLS